MGYVIGYMSCNDITQQHHDSSSILIVLRCLKRSARMNAEKIRDTFSHFNVPPWFLHPHHIKSSSGYSHEEHAFCLLKIQPAIDVIALLIQSLYYSRYIFYSFCLYCACTLLLPIFQVNFSSHHYFFNWLFWWYKKRVQNFF